MRKKSKQQVNTEELSIDDLKQMTNAELKKIASDFGITGYSSLKKQDLVAKILEAKAIENGVTLGEGVLDTRPEGFGFLRSADSNYRQGPNDIYVSQSQIRKFGLRKGHIVSGQVRPPQKDTSKRKEENYSALVRIEAVNSEDPNAVRGKTPFDDLISIYPDERIKLEHSPREFSTRIMDLIAPIGKGQRGLIVAPPRGGKTELLKRIARGVTINHPEIMLMILLINERPEEVTDMKRTANGEVVSATFDDPAQHHIELADMVLEKSKRLVEYGNDVMILLDSMTRLGRAHNSMAPSSGRVMTGGVESNALNKPRQFFGAARNIENGGSLTIIATTMQKTGSRMDDVIFEEFKGTGNMEIRLDRDLLDRMIFPAMDIKTSKTRRDDLLLSEDEMGKIWLLRRSMAQANPPEAMEFLLERLSVTKTNEEFLESMKG